MPSSDPVERPAELLALSAETPAALARAAECLEAYVRNRPRVPLRALCAAVNAERPRPHRAAMVAGSLDDLREHLNALTAGARRRGRTTGHARGDRPRVAFLFTGQGSQYAGMGRQLAGILPAFARSLHRCADALAPHLPRPLLAVLFDDDGSPAIHETQFTQPALVSLGYSLAQVWRSWGVTPHALLGHSVGEYAAACVSGMCGLDDGLRLVALRGRLMQERPPGGAMAAVFADEPTVARAIEPCRDVVSIAAVNGPANVVVSGAGHAVDALRSSLAARGVASHALTESHAFHSPLMEPMLDAFEQAAGRIRTRPPQVPIASNVTGRVLPAGYAPDARYWRQHARGAVRFADGVAALRDEACDTFIELGPDPVLIGMAKRCLPAGDLAWVPSLERSRDNWQTLLGGLGTLFVRGVPVDWTAVCGGPDPALPPLPEAVVAAVQA
jgi:myxalamid-type polyketide synthase MxaB